MFEQLAELNRPKDYPQSHFEVMLNDKIETLPTQSEAIAFAKLWNGLYQVVIYSNQTGYSKRIVIHERQF